MDGYLLSWRQDTDTLGWDLIRDIQWPCLVSWWHWTQWSASCGWSFWGVMPGETSSHLICDCIMIFKSSWEMIWSVSLSVKYIPLGFLVSKSEQVLEGGAWWPQLEVTQSDSGQDRDTPSSSVCTMCTSRLPHISLPVVSLMTAGRLKVDPSLCSPPINWPSRPRFIEMKGPLQIFAVVRVPCCASLLTVWLSTSEAVRVSTREMLLLLSALS